MAVKFVSTVLTRRRKLHRWVWMIPEYGFGHRVDIWVGLDQPWEEQQVSEASGVEPVGLEEDLKVEGPVAELAEELAHHILQLVAEEPIPELGSCEEHKNRAAAEEHGVEGFLAFVEETSSEALLSSVGVLGEEMSPYAGQGEEGMLLQAAVDVVEVKIGPDSGGMNPAGAEPFLDLSAAAAAFPVVVEQSHYLLAAEVLQNGFLGRGEVTQPGR